MNLKYAEANVGMCVEVVGFDCMDGRQVIQCDDKGLYVPCTAGKHYLDGQLDDDGTLVGIFKAE